MSVIFQNFGFYNIDINYLAYLSSKDSEVYYDSTKAYERKPFLGIVVIINSMNYLLPLTSAKAKHKNWADSTNEHFLIFESVSDDMTSHPNWIVKPGSTQKELKHLLAVLDLKKMIPVPDGLFTLIDINAIADNSYRLLMQKEYFFLKSKQLDILKATEKLYSDQTNSGKVHKFHCNYRLLEQASLAYQRPNQN